jgi:hypothetical protein
MRSLNELPEDALKVALEAAETLVTFNAYLPPGGLLFLLLGRWRDDIREALGMELEELPRRAREHKPLDELTSVELGSVSGAVMILLQARFTWAMDDPALPRLLREYEGMLAKQQTEREQIQVEIGA